VELPPEQALDPVHRVRGVRDHHGLRVLADPERRSTVLASAPRDDRGDARVTVRILDHLRVLPDHTGTDRVRGPEIDPDRRALCHPRILPDYDDGARKRSA